MKEQGKLERDYVIWCSVAIGAMVGCMFWIVAMASMSYVDNVAERSKAKANALTISPKVRILPLSTINETETTIDERRPVIDVHDRSLSTGR